MENIGGKIVICFVFSLLLLSCDKSVPVSINNGKNMRIATDCGKITFTSSKFSSAVFFSQQFEGSFLVQPELLKLEFSPQFVGMKNLTFSVGDEQRKNNDSFQVNNNYVGVRFTVFSETPVSLDIVTMVILPCDYIMCNNKPLLTDTIRISLKDKR